MDLLFPAIYSEGKILPGMSKNCAPVKTWDFLVFLGRILGIKKIERNDEVLEKNF